MRLNWSTGLLRLIHSNKRDMMTRASMIRVNILTRIRGSNMLDLSSEILSLISPKNILWNWSLLLAKSRKSICRGIQTKMLIEGLPLLKWKIKPSVSKLSRNSMEPSIKEGPLSSICLFPRMPIWPRKSNKEKKKFKMKWKMNRNKIKSNKRKWRTKMNLSNKINPNNQKKNNKMMNKKITMKMKRKFNHNKMKKKKENKMKRWSDRNKIICLKYLLGTFLFQWLKKIFTNILVNMVK